MGLKRHHIVTGFGPFIFPDLFVLTVKKNFVPIFSRFALPLPSSKLWSRSRVFEMKFVMEFAEDLILRLMEDPKERDRKFREHVYAVKEQCKKTKEMWSYPVRPYGHWTFPRQNAQLAWDSQISQVPGRRDPYDDLLQDNYRSSK